MTLAEQEERFRATCRHEGAHAVCAVLCGSELLWVSADRGAHATPGRGWTLGSARDERWTVETLDPLEIRLGLLRSLRIALIGYITDGDPPVAWPPAYEDARTEPTEELGRIVQALDGGRSCTTGRFGARSRWPSSRCSGMASSGSRTC